jgi:hypothetical protein
MPEAGWGSDPVIDAGSSIGASADIVLGAVVLVTRGAMIDPVAAIDAPAGNLTGAAPGVTRAAAGTFWEAAANALSRPGRVGTAKVERVIGGVAGATPVVELASAAKEARSKLGGEIVRAGAGAGAGADGGTDAPTGGGAGPSGSVAIGVGTGVGAVVAGAGVDATGPGLAAWFLTTKAGAGAGDGMPTGDNCASPPRTDAPLCCGRS